MTNLCMYTNNLCENAREDGDCRIGYQNCTKGSWFTDDMPIGFDDCIFDDLTNDEDEDW